MRLIIHQIQVFVNHLEQVEELLKREPLPLPRLEIVEVGAPLRGLDGLLKMIPVDVIIAERVDELSDLQTANVRDHVRQ